MRLNWLEDELNALKVKNLYRKRVLREGLRDFCSNDYLALKDHPRVLEASKKALEKYGLGAGASQLVSGYTEYHRELEESLARFKGTPACLLFGSGYLANLGVIPTLAQEGDIILSDELNHASLIDGCRLSRAERFVFRHRDYEELEAFLKKERHRFRRALIVTDGVFSMDGDIADLKALSSIAEKYECLLYIDDAHGTGTVGKGKGTLTACGLKWKEYIVLMGTLSKALGSYGAFVCGTGKLVELLVNRARSLIFTTALPPAICAGARESLRIIEEKPELVVRLGELASFAYSVLKDLPFEVRFSGTPIIPIIVGEEVKALKLSEKLRKKGVLLQAIRYPTVPKGKARLRMTVSLRHSEEDILELKSLLSTLLRG